MTADALLISALTLANCLSLLSWRASTIAFRELCDDCSAETSFRISLGYAELLLRDAIGDMGFFARGGSGCASDTGKGDGFFSDAGKGDGFFSDEGKGDGFLSNASKGDGFFSNAGKGDGFFSDEGKGDGFFSDESKGAGFFSAESKGDGLFSTVGEEVLSCRFSHAVTSDRFKREGFSYTSAGFSNSSPSLSYPYLTALYMVDCAAYSFPDGVSL